MDSVNPLESNALNQADFLKLFMQELSYQDPLKPVDNREFMAQMAQFSSLQAQQTTNEDLEKLLSMTTANQALSLLEKSVKIKGADENGIVKKIVFKEDAPPTLSVFMKGEFSDITLNDIEAVMPS